MGSQFGLINVNVGQSSDPDTELQILEDVGSYGRQIGRIGDALAVLLNYVRLEKLNAEEKAAINQLRDQLKAVDNVKTKRLHKRG